MLDQGADHVKIFTGSYVGTGPAVLMLLPVVQAVTAEAHARGNWCSRIPRRSKASSSRSTAASTCWPTPRRRVGPGRPNGQGNGREGHELDPHPQALALRAHPHEAAAGRRRSRAGYGGGQLGIFAKAGGDILFGTDLGYMTDYDPTEEYPADGRGGHELPSDPLLAHHQSGAQIRRSGGARSGGGWDGGGSGGAGLDDAWKRIESLADVSYTIRAGRVIYERQ